MAFLSTIDRTATIGTTEYSIAAGTTTGVPTSQTTEAIIEAVIDFSASAAGDQFEVAYYDAAISGGTQRKLATQTFSGIQDPPIQVMPPIHFRHAYDITVKKLAGTDRSLTMSLRRVG